MTGEPPIEEAQMTTTESVNPYDAEVARILGPGSYLAHGAFLGDFNSLVEDGNLMSPIARQNYYLRNGIKKPIHSKDLLLGHHPHASAIYFYQWGGRPDAGCYIGTGRNDPRGAMTNMAVLIPSEVAIRYARAIDLNGIVPGKGTDQEIGLTDSQKALDEGKFVFDEEDHTALPIEELFFIVPQANFQVVVDILKKAYSDQWIKEHLFPIEMKQWMDHQQGLWRNDFPRALQERKLEIDAWFDNRQKTSGRTIVQPYSNPFTSHKIYSAHFIQGVV